MQRRHITLFIPGLLGGGLLREARYFDGLSVAALERLLSRARRQHHDPVPAEASLFRLFGYPALPGDPLPVAAVSHLADLGHAPPHPCLRADPVNLQPDRDRVVMIGNQGLAVTRDEARQLVEAFNRLFGTDGLRLEVAAPQRWYLLAERAPAIRTWPLSLVLDQDIDPHLPAGEEALYWHKILNEVQMLFYSHPVNEARRRRGQPEINSVWLWGEGALPVLDAASWRQLWGNEPLALALARLAGVEAATLPASAEEWLEQADLPGDHLVLIDALAEALRGQDLQRWRDMIEAVNEVWLEPLAAALGDGRLGGIRLLGDHAEFQIDRRTLRRWWRRRRPLAQLVH